MEAWRGRERVAEGVRWWPVEWKWGRRKGMGKTRGKGKGKGNGYLTVSAVEGLVAYRSTKSTVRAGSAATTR